ncbi:MAG: protein kinase, partial [Methanosarcinaceae archaeon]|nr:protein kinase [Methanosarcinaceae archaeon]
GVIHGDIWQNNIMVTRTDDLELRFFDLGASARRDTILLRPDALAARRSDKYCAPERRLGERHGRRSDIYSLGGLFYFMACGQSPPDSISNIDSLKNTIVLGIEKTNPSLLESNCGIADIIARCMRESKDQRIRDADTLLNEIRLFSFTECKEENQRIHKCVTCLLSNQMKSFKIDSLFSRMLEIDASHFISRADDMLRGILEVSGDHENLVLGMSAYLSVLGNGDSFYAKTTPRFWAEGNMGINGRFLSMVKLVARRGANVKLIMLVCDTDRTIPEYRRILEAHLKATKKVETLQFYCKVVSADERQKIMRNARWECCYAISEDQIKGLQPVFDENDILRTIRFIQQEISILPRVKNEMEKELAKATPLTKWMVSYGPNN